MAPAIGKGRFQGLLDVDISTPCGGFGAEELTNDPLRPTDTTGCGAEDSIGYFWCEYSPPRLSSSGGTRRGSKHLQLLLRDSERSHVGV